MKYSIVIPAYNEEKFVASTIKAALAQDVGKKNFEVIVVDNNSKDKTSEVAKKAGADKVVVEKKQGTNMARQKGLEVSKGDIVAFLDADSEPPKDWLKKIGEVLDEGEYAAVSGPYKYGSWQDIAFSFFPYITPIFQFIFRKKAGVMMGGNFALPRKTINKIGKLPQVEFYGDDTYIAVTVARKVGRVLFTPKIWVKSSPRRFKEQGTFGTAIKYFYNFIKVYFTAKI